MVRHLPSIATAASLVVFALLCVLSARSFYTPDGSFFNFPFERGGFCGLEFEPGMVIIERASTSGVYNRQFYWITFDGPNNYNASRSWLGFSTFAGKYATGVTMPVLLILLLAMAIPIRHFRYIPRFIKWNKRRALGQCPMCGYDLRATTGRCPECGNVATLDVSSPETYSRGLIVLSSLSILFGVLGTIAGLSLLGMTYHSGHHLTTALNYLPGWTNPPDEYTLCAFILGTLWIAKAGVASLDHPTRVLREHAIAAMVLLTTIALMAIADALPRWWTPGEGWSEIIISAVGQSIILGAYPALVFWYVWRKRGTPMACSKSS